MALWDDLDRRERETLAKLDELDLLREPLLADLADIRVAKAALRPSALPLFQSSPDDRAYVFYKGLTLKQLAVRALADHFTEGATANQLLDYFERAYGRQIERSSLSPQLSRLKDEGDLVLDGKLWKLPEPKPGEAAQGDASPMGKARDVSPSRALLGRNNQPPATGRS